MNHRLDLLVRVTTTGSFLSLAVIVGMWAIAHAGAVIPLVQGFAFNPALYPMAVLALGCLMLCKLFPSAIQTLAYTLCAL